MKSILFTLSFVIAGAAHAEISKECPWNCRMQIDYIDAKYFPLTAPNHETRQEAIKDVRSVGISSEYQKVKLRAVEALNSNSWSMNQKTRELALRSIGAIASRTNDEQLECKSLQILAHSLKAQSPQVRLLTGMMIASIGSRSDQKMTQNVAMNLIESSSDAHVLKTMLANQSK